MPICLHLCAATTCMCEVLYFLKFYRLYEDSHFNEQLFSGSYHMESMHTGHISEPSRDPYFCSLTRITECALIKTCQTDLNQGSLKHIRYYHQILVLWMCIQTTFFKHNYVNNYVITGIQMKMSCIYKWEAYMLSPARIFYFAWIFAFQIYTLAPFSWIPGQICAVYFNFYFNVSTMKFILFCNKFLFLFTIPSLG